LHPSPCALAAATSDVVLDLATGRIEAAVGYSDAGQIVLGRSREALPYGIEGALGLAYQFIGQPERLAELCRAQLARAATRAGRRCVHRRAPSGDGDVR